MSKAAAIHTAVWAELASEGKPYPSTGKETMGATYLYDATTIPIYLRAVRDRLADDTPPFTFDWTKIDINDALGETPGALCDDISDATT